MTDADEMNGPVVRRRLLFHALAVAAVAGTCFAAGYKAGVARQEKRLLREFVVNAARLGILDCDRLRELTDEGADAGTEEASETVEGGRP